MSVRAGSSPPTSSITRSTSSALATAAGSAVRRSTASERGLARSRTAARCRTRLVPAARESTSWRSMSARATACPTVPMPSNPIRTCCFMRRVYDTLRRASCGSTAGLPTRRVRDGRNQPQPQARHQGRPARAGARSPGRVRAAARPASRRRRGDDQDRQPGGHHRRLLLLAGGAGRAVPESEARPGAARGPLGRLAAQELRVLHRPGRTARSRRGPRRRSHRQQDHRHGRDLVGVAIRREAARAASLAPQRGARRPAGSVRLDFTQGENALAQALAARRSPYVDLTLSNPTAAGFPVPSIPLPDAPSYEPHPRGLPAALEAVAAYHGVQPERVVLTASTSEAYSWLFKLLCDAGDEVLVPDPSYPLFGYLTALECVRAVPYALRWDGEWHLEASVLRFSGRTRAVLVVSPGNPTGAYLKEDERAALASACRAHGCALISDEVFADFPAFEDARRARSAALYDDVLAFSLSGLSKVAGLPQLKLGWIAAGGPGAGDAVDRLELIADTYLSVSTPVQLAAPDLLANRGVFQQAVRARLATNRAALAAARAQGDPWDVLRAEGGWNEVLSIPRSRTEEEWALALLEAGVLVHPGYFFDFSAGAHLVLSLLALEGDFERAAQALARVLHST